MKHGNITMQDFSNLADLFNGDVKEVLQNAHSENQKGNCRELDLNMLIAFADVLGGVKTVGTVIRNRKGLSTVKYGEFSIGQIEALINKIGGAKEVKSILWDEKKVVLNDIIVNYFDNNGRRIPTRQSKLHQSYAHPDFKFAQPNINYKLQLERLQLSLGLQIMTASEFEQRSAKIIKGIRSDKSTAGILNGPYFPFCLPKLEVVDYGKTFTNIFLPALKDSYEREFPDRQFRYMIGSDAKMLASMEMGEYCPTQEELPGNINIVPSSRHKQLVDAMQQRAVVGVFFPASLQGYSINDQHEQMKDLPKSFVLAGGFDSAACAVAYPDIIFSEQTPLIRMLGIKFRNAYTLYMMSDEYTCNFYKQGAEFSDEPEQTGGLVALG